MDEESFITSRFTGLISFMKLANETSQRAKLTVTRRPEKFASLLFKSAHHWVSHVDSNTLRTQLLCDVAKPHYF